LSPSTSVWYFAYGSNLNMDQMKERVGDWQLSKRALVRNYKLVFNHHSKKWQGYTANLQPTGKLEDVVYGVVYHLTQDQLARLQAHEGVPPTETVVELEDGNEISRAKVFIWRDSDPGHEPSTAYRKTMEIGLADHGYDKAHIDRIFRQFAESSS
jgi:cation transport regulator ChaC